jgi:hypothetical protein
MKHNNLVMGLVTIATLCGVSVTGQISYQNGDMLAAFRDSSSPNTDLIVDLGSISLFQQTGAAAFNVNANLSSALLGTFGSDLSGLNWSVFGYNGINTIYNTLARSNPGMQTLVPQVGGTVNAQGLVANDIDTISSLTTVSAWPGIANLFANIITVPVAAGGYTALMAQGLSNGDFDGDWTYNIENTGAGVSDLYQSVPKVNSFDSKSASYLGNFSLNGPGNLIFNPVPEPATWSVIGAGMMTLLAVRRFRRSN